MNGLTAKQAELLRYIRAYCDDKGYSPSFDEMAEAVGLQSKSGVFRLVNALEERNYITRLPNRARAIYPNEQQTFDVYMPVELRHRVQMVADSLGTTPNALIASLVTKGLATVTAD